MQENSNKEIQEVDFLLKVFSKIESMNGKLPPEEIKKIKSKFLQLSTKYLDGTRHYKTESGNINVDSIKEDTTIIRKLLSIQGSQSVDFSFIDNERVQKQLIKDNIKMEGCRLKIDCDDLTRFYNFCVEAFFQIEELLNFYYFKKFPLMEDLNRHFESFVDTKFKRKLSCKNVGDIECSQKIWTFGRTFFIGENDFTGHTLNNVRKVRNEELHRCSVIEQSAERNSLQYFLKLKSYDTVRNSLVKLAITVKDNI